MLASGSTGRYPINGSDILRYIWKDVKTIMKNQIIRVREGNEIERWRVPGLTAVCSPPKHAGTVAPNRPDGYTYYGIPIERCGTWVIIRWPVSWSDRPNPQRTETLPAAMAAIVQELNRRVRTGWGNRWAAQSKG